MANQKPSIRGTRTEKNIVAAYLSESAAYTRYTYYAAQAKKEGFPPVQKLFEETAANELHHGKVYFRMLQGGSVEVPITADAGVISDTASNLKTAMEEEKVEGVDQYIKAAAVAREEGFDEIASHFEAIAKVEKHHMERFARFLKHIEDGTLWKRDKEVTWQCMVCGFLFRGTEPPETCPACDHPRIHYFCAEDFE